jgi:hypothetical protein
VPVALRLPSRETAMALSKTALSMLAHTAQCRDSSHSELPRHRVNRLKLPSASPRQVGSRVKACSLAQVCRPMQPEFNPATLAVSGTSSNLATTLTIQTTARSAMSQVRQRKVQDLERSSTARHP